METQFTPIAMRCTKAQFKAVEPKLKGIKKQSTKFEFNDYPYITNMYDEEVKIRIGTINKELLPKRVFEWFETWDEATFLKACGIEVDTYTVSKGFILEAHKDACYTWKTKIENQFTELFPKAELELNNWYKVKEEDDSFWFVEKIKEDGDGVGYGFCIGEYKHCDTINIKKFTFIQATKEEVETALKNEWKKIAKKYDYSVKTLDGYELHECGFEIVYNFTKNKAYLNSSGYQCIFDNGKWAEIISEPIELSLDEIAEKFGVDVSLIKIKK